MHDIAGKEVPGPVRLGVSAIDAQNVVLRNDAHLDGYPVQIPTPTEENHWAWSLEQEATAMEII